ncbi:molecular chaperone [Desulforhopalus sp. IMCC35007]|uniref:TorD/DmsD family molecular chaperone n=1 Tax=Desulforhopalus sp. IMCC35007 TaxID=2569543 RepID=UPI00145E83E8|nr:molecular chaperone TorD family protein [Desulforhopalus sp. IMCC35007]
MMNEINKLISRGDCFKLLAVCFYEPEKKLFTEEKLGENLGHLLADISFDARIAADSMQRALCEISQENLSIDHASLFVGPFELIAAPYGSVYIDKKRTVMGESTLYAARCYQEAGLAVDIKEPQDHIAIELEFMYFLCSKEAAARQENRMEDADRFQDLQARFYYNAMRPWVNEFCDAIQAGSKNEFYLGVARCLDHFLSACESVYGRPPVTCTDLKN